MPEQLSPEAFIGRELRPQWTPSENDPPPLPPDAPQSEIQRQAAALLGADPQARLVIGDPSINGDQTYVRTQDVAWSAVDGEAVLLDLGSGYYFSLNGVGTAIWEKLDGEHTLASIHEAICSRFDVDAEVAWEDISTLVQRLCSQKLAVLAPCP
jgi:hypothetical protein